MSWDLIVVGGGAAGFFAAVNAAELRADLKVLLLEATNRPLAKVEISGGGRCNVTHSCFDPTELIERYPRGAKELRGPFSRFQPKDVIKWFEAKGVELKTESDGRMFPTTDSSQTIIDCLLNSAKKSGVETRYKVKIEEAASKNGVFALKTKDQEELISTNLLLATGSSRTGHEIAKHFGHAITPLAPSLFTFEISDLLLSGLSGTAFSDCIVELKTQGKLFKEQGPVLITHWGLSGPAVLKLSAWAARELHHDLYRADLKISWVNSTVEDAKLMLRKHREENPRKTINRSSPFDLTARFWERLCERSDISSDLTYSALSNLQLETLASKLCGSRLTISGKGEFKEEFVTCGGVALNEVDFRTMESRLQRGLFFAGEILDIDGITGGFNFQAAWTTAWHVAKHLENSN